MEKFIGFRWNHVIYRNHKLWYFFWCVLYRICLDVGYSQIIANQYSELGFIAEPSFFLAAYSWFILIVFICLTYKCYCSKDNVSNEIIFILFLLSMVPTTTLTAYGQFSEGYIASYTLYWMALLVIYRMAAVKNVHLLPPCRYKKGNEKYLIIIFFAMAATIIYVSGKYAHFRIHFNLLTVYEIRDEAAGYELSSLIRYVYGWTRIVMPVFIIYFLKRRKRLLAWSCFLLEMLNFGIEGSKTVFFMAIAAVVIGHLPQFDMAVLNHWILAGLTSFFTLCIWLYYHFDNIVPVSMFMRRMLFAPSYLSWCYYDYILGKRPDYFKGSFLRHFGFNTEYPGLDSVIGKLYLNSPETHANNGLLSDAFVNLGFAGLVVMPVLLWAVFRAADRGAKDLDSRIYILIALYTGISLTNSFLTTALMTHGLLVTIILLHLMKKEHKGSG